MSTRNDNRRRERPPRHPRHAVDVESSAAPVVETKLNRMSSRPETTPIVTLPVERLGLLDEAGASVGISAALFGQQLMATRRFRRVSLAL